MFDKCRDCERTPGLGSTILCYRCRDIEGKRIEELETQLSEANKLVSNIDKWMECECNYGLLDSSIVDEHPGSL